MTESLLYKQIVRFLEEEGIRDMFEIAFITIESGIMNQESGKEHNSLFMIPNSKSLPPKNFRSGRSWISKKVKEEMAENIAEYLKTQKHKNTKTIAYARGSYLEAVRLAVKKSGVEVKEIFDDDELAQLKKKGIMWMKVGLRMPTAFIIFRMKMRFIAMENNSGQLRLF